MSLQIIEQVFGRLRLTPISFHVGHPELVEGRAGHMQMVRVASDESEQVTMTLEEAGRFGMHSFNLLKNNNKNDEYFAAAILMAEIKMLCGNYSENFAVTTLKIKSVKLVSYMILCFKAY